MLEKLLLKLAEDLELGSCPAKDPKGAYPLPLGEKQLILCSETQEEILLTAPVAALAQERQEEVCTLLMRANFLGQGTGKSVLGLDESEKTLTLSLVLPYEMDYPSFKASLEEFSNYLGYWQEELAALQELH